MLRDYRKVLNFLKRLDEYALRMHDKHLADIDRGEYRSALDYLYHNSEYARQFNACKEAWGELSDVEKGGSDEERVEYALAFWNRHVKDINLCATLAEMSDNDCMNFLNSIVSSQIGDFVIIRYNEIRIFNNKLLSGNTFDMYDGLMRECRSIIVNIREFSIISLPFYKFMNMNEAEDYKQEKVMERLRKAKVVEYSDKLDGSFVQITKLDKQYNFYNYGDILSSSKNIWDTEIVVWARNWYEAHRNYKNMIYNHPEYTFMFESISMADKHVVKYSKDQEGLYLIGARHKETGELLTYAEVKALARQYDVLCTTLYDITFDELVGRLKKEKAADKEGYVVNLDGFLVKMKCTDYLEMVLILKENGSMNAVIKAVSNDSLGELYSMLPEEYHAEVKVISEEIYEFIEAISGKVEECLQYLYTGVIDRKDIDKWCRRLPRCIGGTVKNLYFCHIKNKQIYPKLDYLRTNNCQLVDNYINMSELRKRRKLVEEFDLQKLI